MERKNVCQPPEYTMDDFSEFFEREKERALRLNEIEAITGDDYDLDRLRELVEADREGRCVVFLRGYPVVSEYQTENKNGLYIKTATGVISKNDYDSALKGETDHD